MAEAGVEGAPAPAPHLAAATEEQPRARAALVAALATEPSHAYLLAGPRGTGKAAAARAFAAELLAGGAADPGDARRRVLADPSPHPDLVWLRPPGAQHLVEEVRERVITAAAYRPFEADRRAFVIEAAEAMADESQNALLKTLEEPAPHVHLLLISSEPDLLLDTVRSRCQPVRFAGLAPGALERRLGEIAAKGDAAERTAAARLAAGDLGRAAKLLGESGRDLRGAVEDCARAARSGRVSEAPWRRLLELAGEEGEGAGEEARERLQAAAEMVGSGRGPSRRELDEAVRRAGRRARTEVLGLGLALAGAWFRDLAAVGEGAADMVLAADRLAELEADAEGLDPRRARRAAELVAETRRRLRVNVSEELALEALFYRAEYLLGASGGSSG